VIHQDGLSALMCSGIIGMSPIANEKLGSLYIHKLKESGAIDEAVFSIYINLKDKTSKITFGGYSLDRFSRSN
jgi:hypothetical protein